MVLHSQLPLKLPVGVFAYITLAPLGVSNVTRRRLTKSEWALSKALVPSNLMRQFSMRTPLGETGTMTACPTELHWYFKSGIRTSCPQLVLGITVTSFRVLGGQRILIWLSRHMLLPQGDPSKTCSLRWCDAWRWRGSGRLCRPHVSCRGQ